MKIICIGRNYVDHAKELNNEIPKKPVVFIKPDSALLRMADFYTPPFSDEIHYETEIVLKINKAGKHILKENAHKHYNEIALGIDFTARDLQNELKSKGLPWELAKGFDGSAVVSEFFDKKDFDLNHLPFSMKLNKETVQEGNTQSMIFSFDEIIAFVSQYFTLKLGDLIFTGTPKGVGKVNENDTLEGYLQDKKVIDIRVL